MDGGYVNEANHLTITQKPSRPFQNSLATIDDNSPPPPSSQSSAQSNGGKSSSAIGDPSPFTNATTIPIMTSASNESTASAPLREPPAWWSQWSSHWHDMLTRMQMPAALNGPWGEQVSKLRQHFRFEFYNSKDAFFGGQLKTKNGQKYVFNGPPSGVYFSKACLVFSGLITVLALIFAVMITYFITANQLSTASCLNGNSAPSPQHLDLTGHRNESSAVAANSSATQPVATASMLGMGPFKPGGTAAPTPSVPIAPVGDIPSDHEVAVVDDKPKQQEGQQLHLYDGWKPLEYTIIIEPNLATSSNNGSITIHVERDANLLDVMPVVLDVHNISISNVRVIRGDANDSTNGDEIELDFDSDYGDDNATFAVTLAKDVNMPANGQLIISMDFVSAITDTLQGIYKTSYVNVDTNEREWMVSTQFSPIDARRAFPCFDRPDMKANFTISIIRETNKTMALSNMPLYHSAPHRPGYVRDDFQTSQKMSTYLVAFIVSNLAKSHYADLDANMVPRVEIWSRPEHTQMTNFAYQSTRRFLPFYENYFGIKNRLAKIDMVAVPDFGFSAMENWGLITFRDSSLLVPEDLERASSSEHMTHVAQIIAHELAHEWFGNLITPRWWDDLWLKESFACYMSYLALNQVHPEYQIMDTFTVLEFKEAMQHDADSSSHPISFDIKSSHDIRRIFDRITYSKGPILLRMLNSIVGNDAFRGATQELLKVFAYQNADRGDLWEFMTKHGHKQETLPESMQIKDVMDTWIQKPGYPVVTVVRDKTNLLISQERYALPSKNASDASRWTIPITYETDDLHKGDNIPTHWMTDQDQQITIENVFATENNSDNVVYLNLNRQGYYRVNYDTKSWLALKKKFNTLPRITRAQILDDSLHLARGEYLTYDVPLTFLMELYNSPDDELLWSAARHGLNYLIYMLQREQAYETFRAFMKYMVRPAFDRYGLKEPENESHLQLSHRATVARFACKFNYEQCTMAAQHMFRSWRTNPTGNVIKPNLKPVIYCTALAEGSFHDWYFAYDQYKRTTSASEKEQLLTSMGCTVKPWLLSKFLNMTINPESGILKQDGARAFRAVAENPLGFDIAFEFLQSNIKEIAEYYGDGFSTITEMISSITTYMNKEYYKKQLEQFAEHTKELGLNSVADAIALAMEQVNNNIYWRNRSYYNLKDFLEVIVSDMRITVE